MSGISYFTASVDLPDDARLLSGMSVEVKVLNQSTKGAATISMKALQFDNENHPFINYLDEEKKLQVKPVTVGINNGLTVEIKEGLKPGDTIYYPSPDGAMTRFGSYEGE
jgi:HlyD family secretion protein